MKKTLKKFGRKFFVAMARLDTVCIVDNGGR